VQPSHGHDQTRVECYDTRYEAERYREFFYEIFSMRQEFHAYCGKFSSRTDNLNLQVCDALAGRIIR
jgi:hypothetical protein